MNNSKKDAPNFVIFLGPSLIFSFALVLILNSVLAILFGFGFLNINDSKKKVKRLGNESR